MIPSRRSFLTGFASALAAPAIVRAASLMPIRAPKLAVPEFEWPLRVIVPISTTIYKNDGSVEEIIHRHPDNLTLGGIPVFFDPPREPNQVWVVPS